MSPVAIIPRHGKILAYHLHLVRAGVADGRWGLFRLGSAPFSICMSNSKERCACERVKLMKISLTNITSVANQPNVDTKPCLSVSPVADGPAALQ